MLQVLIAGVFRGENVLGLRVFKIIIIFLYIFDLLHPKQSTSFASFFTPLIYKKD